MSDRDRALAIAAASWLAACVGVVLASAIGSDLLGLVAAAPAVALCARLAGRLPAVLVAAAVPAPLLVAGVLPGDAQWTPIDVTIATLLLAAVAGTASTMPKVVEVERRADTVQSLRRLRRAIHECAGAADGHQAVAAVADALVDTLRLQACWFEWSSDRTDVAELTVDGDTTALVHHRLPEGLALPPLVALPVSVGLHRRGRFLMEADPAVGLSPERRMVAVALGELAALRVDAGPGPARPGTAGRALGARRPGS